MSEEKRFHTDEAIVYVTPQVSRQWLYKGRIVVLTPLDMKRETIDVWAAELQRLFNAWPAELPFLNVHDLSKVENFALTPYIRSKVEPIMQSRPEIATRSAAIVPRGFGVRVVRLFFNSVAVRNPRRQRNLFFSLEEGIKWVAEWLDPTKYHHK